MRLTALLNRWLILLPMMIDVLNSAPHPKPIVNGKAVTSNQFPFAVAFSTRSERLDSFQMFCGGSLIKQSSRYSWAISAAHCFLDADLARNQIYASVGGGDLADNKTKWFEVENFVLADMNIYSFQNDIALVRIRVDFQQVIPLAKAMPSNNAECLIYGYGSLSYHGDTSSVLRYGAVRPISYERCEKILGRVTAPSTGMGQFCALGKHGVDACNGDSGSGLICRGDGGRLELVGVTSHGMGCGEGVAGIYESTIHHHEWIDSILQQRLLP